MGLLPGFRLHVRFNDGTQGNVELASFLHSETAGVFAALRDAKLFAQARIECGAVTWPGELDLDAMHRAIKEHGGGSWSEIAGDVILTAVHTLLDAGILQKTRDGRLVFPFDAIRVDVTLRAA